MLARAVSQIAAGSAHSLALCSDGLVCSFGRATAGQCGHGASGDAAPNVLVPTRVAALAALACVRAVLAHGDASAAVLAGGAPGGEQRYLWGRGAVPASAEEACRTADASAQVVVPRPTLAV